MILEISVQQERHQLGQIEYIKRTQIGSKGKLSKNNTRFHFILFLMATPFEFNFLHRCQFCITCITFVHSICNSCKSKYDKQDQQGKAAFNERNPHTTQQQKPLTRSPGGPQTKTGQRKRQVNHFMINNL
jgi:hypothetical protein